MSSNQKQLLEFPTDPAAVSLIELGHPLLRRQAKRVTSFEALPACCNLVVEKLRQLQGAGLAANQLGIDLQFMIVEVRQTELFPDRPTSPLYVMANPVVKWHGEESDEDWEGCFSVPRLLGLVPRFKSIQVEYNTTDGAHRIERFDGYVARVIQHEIDHLNGKVYLDRMTSMQSLSTRDNYLIQVRNKRGNDSASI